MRRSFSLLLSVGICCGSAFADDSLPRVPEGFTIERAAAAPLVEHPLMAGFDDRGRLYIAESAGMNLKADELLKNPPNFIRRLEDVDGDGVFDKSTIFADKMTFPQGALWYRDALYVASPPYIWKLKDTDDDGVADERTILVKSFGFTGNAADIHGCFLSPNGRIYWCDGRHGHEFFDENGHITSKGKAARIFSCLPDGSDVRVHCGGGMDNPVEVDFTETGDVIGTVNIFYGQPRIDCLVHWIENGVYPRADQGDCIAEFDYTGELLPPIARMGHVAVSGTMRYRSEEFGPEYRDNFFVSVFNTHRIVRSILTPSGSTYTSREEEFLVSDNPDFHPTDVLEDADGSLLVIDTGGWFRIGCPTSQIAKPELMGAIYRIRKEGAHKTVDPRGKAIDWAALSGEELIFRLGDERPAVRELAVDQLSQRPDLLESDELRHVFDSENSLSATVRRNVLWAIERSGLAKPRALFSLALRDPDESVRIVALRCLSNVDTDDELRNVAAFLKSESRAERRAAAVNLEHELKRIVPKDETRRIALTNPLIDALDDPQLDRHLEHSLVHAMLKSGEPATMLAALDCESPALKRNLLAVLSQRSDVTLAKEQVLPYLGSTDPLLQKESLRIVQSHPEWLADIKTQLVAWLTSPDAADVPWDSLRGVLLSTFDQPDIQSALAELLGKDEMGDASRLFLLEILDQSLASGEIEKWSAAIETSLRQPSLDVRRQTLRLLQKDRSGKFDASAVAIFQSSELDPETRLFAVQAIASRLKFDNTGIVEFLLQRMQDDEQTLLAIRAAETLIAIPLWKGSLTEELTRTLPDLPAHVLPLLSKRAAQLTDYDLQVAYLSAVIANQCHDQLSPADVVEWETGKRPANVQKLVAEVVKYRAKQSEARRSRLDALASLLTGGDPSKGEQVFLSRTAACAGCHRINEQGGKIGPDLSQIGRIRTPADLLEAIVFPSASFARGYEPFTVVTGEGRVLNGVIPVETATEVVLRTAEQREHRLRRDNIEALKQSTISVMPQGIDKLLTPDELRDLLAYLSQRK